MGSNLLKSTGKCDRKEELRKGMKSSPQPQLFSDANVPAVGAKSQDTLSNSVRREHGMSPLESQALLAGPPVLSEPQINTAGDRGNRVCKHPFGLEGNTQPRFLTASCGQLLLHGLPAGSVPLSVLLGTEPRTPTRPDCGPWG